MRNPVPRVAAVNDLSGFGRSSLAVIMPIVSSMGIQVCPLPTAILSTHTGGFQGYTFVDFTDYMEDYINHWYSLDIHFDCIYSGFLGSPRQIHIVGDFFDKFSHQQPLYVVDPVLGDNGELYQTMSLEMVANMKELVKKADVITPNFTEAALLLGEIYREHIQEQETKQWLERLSAMGPETVIITSVPDIQSDKVTYVYAYEREDHRFWKIKADFIPAFFPGTGDCFASVVVGSILQGDSLPITLDRAVQFTSLAIRSSYGYRYPQREGVLLERVLDSLKAPVSVSSYEILE